MDARASFAPALSLDLHMHQAVRTAYLASVGCRKSQKEKRGKKVYRSLNAGWSLCLQRPFARHGVVAGEIGAYPPKLRPLLPLKVSRGPLGLPRSPGGEQ